MRLVEKVGKTFSSLKIHQNFWLILWSRTGEPKEVYLPSFLDWMTYWSQLHFSFIAFLSVSFHFGNLGFGDEVSKIRKYILSNSLFIFFYYFSFLSCPYCLANGKQLCRKSRNQSDENWKKLSYQNEMKTSLVTT